MNITQIKPRLMHTVVLRSSDYALLGIDTRGTGISLPGVANQTQQQQLLVLLIRVANKSTVFRLVPRVDV